MSILPTRVFTLHRGKKPGQTETSGRTEGMESIISKTLGYTCGQSASPTCPRSNRCAGHSARQVLSLPWTDCDTIFLCSETRSERPSFHILKFGTCDDPDDDTTLVHLKAFELKQRVPPPWTGDELVHQGEMNVSDRQSFRIFRSESEGDLVIAFGMKRQDTAGPVMKTVMDELIQTRGTVEGLVDSIIATQNTEVDSAIKGHEIVRDTYGHRELEAWNAMAEQQKRESSR